MTTLVRDGLDLHYEATGSGPPVLLPELGYSSSGAFAPWLARPTGRVDAVVSGASPTVGDCGPLRRGLQHTSFPGHDHEGMLADVGEAVPVVLAWYEAL